MVKAFKYHIITVVSVVEGTIDAADCCSGGAGLLSYFQIGIVVPEHGRYLKTLGK